MRERLRRIPHFLRAFPQHLPGSEPETRLFRRNPDGGVRAGRGTAFGRGAFAVNEPYRMHARPRRALIVTDVHLVAWALSSAFGQAGFVALAAETAGAARDVLRTVDDIDLLVISLSIGPSRVSDVLTAVASECPGIRVILLAAEPDASFPAPGTGIILLQQPFSVEDVVVAAARLVGDDSGPATIAAPASAAPRPWHA